MKQTISAPNTVPTANIAVNKSRLKVYKNAGVLPTYYLQKGQEFQIELANPTTDVVLAKVILNGKAISQGGLVLNPGQRVYLERYLDVAKKFLFDTYEVSGSAEMKAAIADNGDIRVEFYKERQPYVNPYQNNGYGQITFGHTGTGNIGSYTTGTPAQFLRSGTSGSIITTGVSSSKTLGFGGSDTTTTSYNANSLHTSSFSRNIAGEATLDMLSDLSTAPEPIKKTLRSRSLSKQTIETGRVEKGSDSDQEFKYVTKSFEFSAFHTVEYKMLPVSQKINTAEDINVKVYCTNCGAKLGKTDKFCASCGTKK